MKAKAIIMDRDTRDTLRALERAARKARQLAQQKGTPFYVVRSGKLVDLNRRPRGRKTV